MRFQRCRELFGEDGFRRVKDIKVIILGVGGVGSYLPRLPLPFRGI